MAGYISSSENRLYVAAEPTFGAAGTAGAGNRIAAVQLKATQRMDVPERRDKTGSRTYFGAPAGVRSRTRYSLSAYLTAWAQSSDAPSHGTIFEAALGGAAKPGAAAGPVTASGLTLDFAGAHGLQPGQAVASGAEIRFVASVASPTRVVLNAPFKLDPGSVDRTVTYAPATRLPTFSVFDYWSPENAVDRILTGAAVDKLRMKINADYQQFAVSGECADIVDSASFEPRQGGLDEFPPEPPAAAGFDRTIIPGHLGQVWLGAAPDRFCTLVDGEISVDNDLDLRWREFGCGRARETSAGVRDVKVKFTLFARDDEETHALYQVARQKAPCPVMFQLGETAGQLCGIYMPAVTLETPEFDDSETRLQWAFEGRAQGFGDDELYIAFS